MADAFSGFGNVGYGGYGASSGGYQPGAPAPVSFDLGTTPFAVGNFDLSRPSPAAVNPYAMGSGPYQQQRGGTGKGDPSDPRWQGYLRGGGPERYGSYENFIRSGGGGPGVGEYPAAPEVVGGPQGPAPVQAAVQPSPKIDAAERYRQLGPETSEADRAAALGEYRTALNAEARPMIYQMAEWRNRMDDKSRYDDWFRSHVADPYNDPNEIGGATLYTDESGQRRMDIPSIKEQEEWQKEADQITKEYGLLKTIEKQARRRDKTGAMRDPKTVVDAAQKARELENQTGVGQGRENLLAGIRRSDKKQVALRGQRANELAKREEARGELRAKAETKREKTQIAQEEGDEQEKRKKVTRARAYEPAGEGYQSGLNVPRYPAPVEEEVPIGGGYESALGYPGYPAPITRTAGTVPVGRERVVPIGGGYESALGYAGGSPVDLTPEPSFLDLVRAKFQASAQEQERMRDSWLQRRYPLPPVNPVPVRSLPPQLLGSQYAPPMGLR